MSKQFKIISIVIISIIGVIFIYLFVFDKNSDKTQNSKQNREKTKFNHKEFTNQELANLALNPDIKSKSTLKKNDNTDNTTKVENSDSNKIEKTEIKAWNKKITKKIITLFTDFSLVDMQAEQLVEILESEGINVKKEKTGNPKTGERYEVIGESKADGLDEFYASFNITEDGKSEFIRAYSTMSPHEESYNENLPILKDKALNQTMKKLSANIDLDNSQRWEFDNEWSLWIYKGKNLNVEESKNPKEMVRVGFELIME